MARPWLDALLVFEYEIPETQHVGIFGDAILHPLKLFVFERI